MIYEHMPPGFKPRFETVACFLENEEEFLLLRRHPDKPFGGTWCLPGGKRATHETLKACVLREILEETRLHISEELRYMKTVYIESGELQYVYHMFRALLTKRPIPHLKIDEHIAYEWKNPKDALKMDLIPNMDTCIQLVYKDLV